MGKLPGGVLPIRRCHQQCLTHALRALPETYIYMGPGYRGERSVHPEFSTRFMKNAEYRIHNFTRCVNSEL